MQCLGLYIGSCIERYSGLEDVWILLKCDVSNVFSCEKAIYLKCRRWKNSFLVK